MRQGLSNTWHAPTTPERVTLSHHPATTCLPNGPPCPHAPSGAVVNHSLRSADHTSSVLLSQMGVMFAVYLVDHHQVFSATEWSGFFRLAKRYREVNLAQNEGHASAVRTGHKRQFCACTPWGGREACGGVPTTAFPIRETLDKAGYHRAGDPLGGGTGAGATPPAADAARHPHVGRRGRQWRSGAIGDG